VYERGGGEVWEASRVFWGVVKVNGSTHQKGTEAGGGSSSNP